MNLKMGIQHEIELQDFWGCDGRASAEQYLKDWYCWVTHSKLEPMVDAAKSIKNHWDGILNYNSLKMTNGLFEWLPLAFRR